MPAERLLLRRIRHFSCGLKSLEQCREFLTHEVVSGEETVDISHVIVIELISEHSEPVVADAGILLKEDLVFPAVGFSDRIDVTGDLEVKAEAVGVARPVTARGPSQRCRGPYPGSGTGAMCNPPSMITPAQPPCVTGSRGRQVTSKHVPLILRAGPVSPAHSSFLSGICWYAP